MLQAITAFKGQREVYRRFKESFLDQKSADLEESSAIFQQAKQRVLLHLKHSYRQQADPKGALSRLRQQVSEAGSSLREAKEIRTEKLRSAYNAVKSRRRAKALPEALDETRVLGHNGLLRVRTVICHDLSYQYHGADDTHLLKKHHKLPDCMH